MVGGYHAGPCSWTIFIITVLLDDAGTEYIWKDRQETCNGGCFPGRELGRLQPQILLNHVFVSCVSKISKNKLKTKNPHRGSLYQEIHSQEITYLAICLKQKNLIHIKVSH